MGRPTGLPSDWTFTDLKTVHQAQCPQTVSVGSLVELEVLVVLHRVRLVALLKVGGKNNVPVVAHRLHARLLHDAMDLGARNLLWPRDVVLEVDVLRQVHLGSEHLEDEPLLAPARLRELDLAVEPTRPQQRWVERVGAVGAHDHLDVDGLVEAVHLGEELHQDALHFAVSTGLCVEALGGDRVDLVDKDDRRRVLARQPEDVTHHPRPLTQVLLHKLRANDADERGGGVVGHRLGEHSLPGAGRAPQQHAARRVDADRPVQVEVCKRQLDGFAHLLLLHVAATNVRVAHVGLLGRAHQRDR
mmetsp:Transcript_20115/g.41040  ORF Transcript_20115/g.41040 Transcript_20115/m.41040 type:complete len:302 (-) Transcript_20115:480-1385(-)